MLSDRRCPKDKREAKRNDYMEADPSHVLGEGILEAYLGVDLDRLGLEEEADAPFVPVACRVMQCCVSELWQMKHTRRHRVPEPARSVGEHAGVRRAPCDEDACAKLGRVAGWRRSQRGCARRAAGCGDTAPSRASAAAKAAEAARTRAPTRGTCGGVPHRAS